MIGIKAFRDLAKTWMKTISPANGFVTTAGENVITERPGDDGTNRKLIVGVYVTDVAPKNITAMRIDWTFQITVEARIPTSMDNAEDLTLEVLEDLLQAVPTQYCNAPKNLKKLVVEGVIFDPQPDGVPYNAVGITLRGEAFEGRQLPA